MDTPWDSQERLSATGRPHFAALDGMRGLAALCVVAVHVIWANPIHDLAFVRNGYLMVDVFFVLSGFVIFYAYQAWLQDAGAVKRFLWLRFWRVYPVHIAFLFAMLAVEIVRFFVQRHIPSIAHPAFSDSNAFAFLMKLFLLQGLHTASGFNYPSWSISVEFCAYLVFVALAFTLRRKALLFLASALISVIFLGCYFALGPDAGRASGDFGVVRCRCGFFLGCPTYEFHEQVRSRWRASSSMLLRAAATASLVALGLFLALKSRGYSDAGIYPLSALAILLIALAPEPGAGRLLNSSPIQWLGKVSYSLYIGHAAVLWGVAVSLRVIFHAGFGALTTDSGDRLVATSMGQGSLGLFVALMLLLGLSHWSYSRIEKPWRDWSRERSSSRVKGNGRGLDLARKLV